MIDTVYFRQAELLLRVLPLVERKPAGQHTRSILPRQQ